MTRIAVIGAGQVGAALGNRFAELGHEVSFGVRDPDEPRQELAAPVKPIAEAVSGAEVVVLAVPWPAVRDIARIIGSADGAVLVDATNPFGGEPPTHGSGAEDLAAWTGSNRVVKAFNTTGFNNMVDPTYPGIQPMLPVAGDDPGARQLVLSLAADLGFDPIDAGPLANARLLESLAALWVSLARSGHGREIAFALLRR